jgi:hypothetical protein
MPATMMELLGVAAAQTCGIHADAIPQVRRDGVELADRLLEQFLHVGQDQARARSTW